MSICFIKNSNIIRRQFARFCLQYRPKTLSKTEENEEIPPDKTGKKSSVKTIQKLFSITDKDALQIVNENSTLIERNEFFLNRNFKLLINNGVDCDTIQKYPELLSVPFLQEAIHRLKTLAYPLNTTIVLACLAKSKLDVLINCKTDKIEWISKFFQVPHDKACEILYKKNFLVTKDPQVISNILKLMTDFGISLEEIRKDPWVLKYSHDLVKARINLFQEKNIKIDSPKPWMIRCPVRVIETYDKRRTENREILGPDSVTEYLSKKLECTQDEAKYLITKMPALARKSPKTLANIIDLLYNKGFQPFHIYRVPNILLHGFDTTKKRLEQISKAKVQVGSLSILTKSQMEFSQYFEASTKKKEMI